MPGCPISRVLCEKWGGWPIKPDFVLSGAVQPQYKVFLLHVPAFAQSIPTRSPLVLLPQSRSGESCSTPNPPDAHTIPPSPDCDECSEAFPQTAHSADIEIIYRFCQKCSTKSTGGPFKPAFGLSGKSLSRRRDTPCFSDFSASANVPHCSSLSKR